MNSDWKIETHNHSYPTISAPSGDCREAIRIALTIFKSPSMRLDVADIIAIEERPR